MRRLASLRPLIGIAFFATTTITAGCGPMLKSRYAMKDPVYAEKYAEGATKSEPLTKLKQAFDARHVGGLAGWYGGGGFQYRHRDSMTLLGAEAGYEYYPTSWHSHRLSLSGYVSPEDWYAGGDLGSRLQLPTRIAPFVGVGTFQGISTTYSRDGGNGLDDDDDGRIDEDDEDQVVPDGYLCSVYPEVGIHFWPVANYRLTAYNRYWISSDGRKSDDWLFGFQLANLHR